MNKSKKYAQTGVLVCGIGNAVINALNQLNSNDLNKKFNWHQFALAAAKGVLVGGTGGFIIGTIRDNKMKEVLLKFNNVPNYLHKTLNYYKDDNILLLKKAEQLKSNFQTKFKDDLAMKPQITGSVVKGTSIYGSDIDIQLHFKRGFGSIANVYDTVSDYVFDELKIKEIKEIREQKHSIGIEIQLENEVKRIDIIPTRLIENGKNDVHLFVNKIGFFEKPTYKKTNPVKQMLSLKLNYREQRIVRLLKVWKIENNLKIKSIYLEWLAKKSFLSRPITNKIEEDLNNVIYFIARNIEFIRIVDAANSNNIISNTLTSDEKRSISCFCFKMLDDMRADKRNTIDYFPSLESTI
jgi:predicted nucleotidyltransferase